MKLNGGNNWNTSLGQEKKNKTVNATKLEIDREGVELKCLCKLTCVLGDTFPVRRRKRWAAAGPPLQTGTSSV